MQNHNRFNVAIVRSNPVSSDPRVMKIAYSLGRNYGVLILGWDRERQHKPLETIGKSITIKRFRLKAPYGNMHLLLFLPIYQVWVFLNLLMHNPQAVHACDLDGAIPSYIFKMGSRRKMVFDVFDRYGLGFLDSKMKKVYQLVELLEEAVASRSDCLITVSKRQLNTFGRRPRFLAVVPNYPMAHRAAKKRYSSEADHHTFKVVSVGGISLHRGLFEMCRAIKDLKDVEFIIAGRSTDPSLFKRVSSFPGVKYVGLLSYRKALELQADADTIPVLVDPDLTAFETVMPNKLFEAMMLAKPVITNVLRDLVINAGCGIVVSYGNVNEIKEAILYLKNNPETRIKMGLRGQEAFQREYNWGEAEKKLLRVYKNLLA